MKEGQGILGEVKKKTVWGNHFGMKYYILEFHMVMDNLYCKNSHIGNPYWIHESILEQNHFGIQNG